MRTRHDVSASVAVARPPVRRARRDGQIRQARRGDGVNPHRTPRALDARRAFGYRHAFAAIPESGLSVHVQADDARLLALGQAVADMLITRGQTIVAAESCTGGWIAKVLTDIAGSSTWFECGVVAYSYEAKEALLGVQPQTLERTGAVSQETVTEMVSGALARYGASVAVAVTGIAGPGGATPGKPVGTVWIGWKRRGGYARAELFQFGGDREAVRRQTVAAALDGVRRILTS
jgi:nicotinamide-nucleotide amidase